MRRALLLLLACAACRGKAGAAELSDAGAPEDAGQAGPALASAFRIADASQLLGGPVGGGRIGDWELRNDRVRFIIEDARPSDGFDPYGCGIAAADRQRDGGPGESRWGELWMGLNFRAAGCEQIGIFNDGSDGQPATLRAIGHDEESPFLSSLFAAQSRPEPLHATIFRQYSLAAGADALLFDLTIQNDGDADLFINEPYVGMAMNRGLRHWIPKSGFDFAPFDNMPLNASAAFYAAIGEKISYSILELRAPFSPIWDFAHVLIGQYPPLRIGRGRAEAFHFAIAVGTGDSGSLQMAHAQVLGPKSLLSPLSGNVVDEESRAIAGARVHVTSAAGDQAFAFARTAADGSWSAALPSGNYSLRALADDRPASAARSISLPAQGVANLQLKLGAASRIDCAAADANGAPLPAKIVLEPLSAPRLSLPPALGEMWDRQPIVIFSADGKASVSVAPGTWHVTFSRGFEYDRPTADVTAPAGGIAVVSGVLHRVVDTSGWLAGDFHVHAQASADADDLVELKVRAFAAEGVEVPVSTEHEFIGDFGAAARALGLSPFMHTISGTEMTTTASGHFNVFPLLPQPGALNNGALAWYGQSVPDAIAQARKRLASDGAAPIVQMNHPRSTGMAYLDAVGFEPDAFAPGPGLSRDFMTNWDAMEIWNGAPLSAVEGCPTSEPFCLAPSHPTAYDWFAFLDRGVRVAGTGNSDSHNAAMHEAGYPRTYLQIGSDDPATVTDAQVSAALRGMKATISGGPFLTISAGPTGIGGLAPASGGIVRLRIEVQAPPWMGKLTRVDLWMGDATPRGAHIAQSIDLSGDAGASVVRLNRTVDLAVASDTWVLATVRGNDVHALWPVVQAAVPAYAITNPIFIDANGDGQFNPLR